MKYSNYIGVASAVAIIIVCFTTWIYIPSLNITLTGLNGKVTNDLNFGKQVYAHSFFALVMIVMFLVQKLWAKRANIFFGAVHFGYALKNYLVFSLCRGGECPEVKPGLYLLVFFALLMLAMALFPKIELEPSAS